MRNKGMKARIIHGSPMHMVKQILSHHQAFAAKREIKGKRIGVIGYPSSWLVASNVDYLLAKRRWGLSISISMEEIYCLYYQITDDIGYKASVLVKQAVACREATPEDFLKAMRLYKAVRIIVRRSISMQSLSPVFH